MTKTRIEDKSFDYVIAFHPQIATEWKLIDPKWNEYKANPDFINNVVRRAISLARKKVLANNLRGYFGNSACVLPR